MGENFFGWVVTRDFGLRGTWFLEGLAEAKSRWDAGGGPIGRLWLAADREGVCGRPLVERVEVVGRDTLICGLPFRWDHFSRFKYFQLPGAPRDRRDPADRAYEAHKPSPQGWLLHARMAIRILRDPASANARKSRSRVNNGIPASRQL